jgi:putative addiction module component (TIGR02574 family)
MTAECKAILDAALALGEKDRAMLADRLLESLHEGMEELSEDEFEAELIRRADECSKEPGARVSWEELENEKP